MEETKLHQHYGTLSETLRGLNKAGYSLDFNIKEDCIVCNTENLTLSPDEFQIDHVYRFEGMSDPEDQSILYAISSPKFGVKGTLVNGYGISADSMSSKLVEKLKIMRN